jgi:hypothetical protein
LGNGVAQRLIIEVPQQRRDAVAEGVPTRPRGRQATQQPAGGLVLAGVPPPLGGTVPAAAHFVQGEAEQQIGPAGQRAGAGVGVVQGGEVQVRDRLVDLSGEVVGCQAAVEVEAARVVVSAGRRGEASRAGVAGRARG